MEEKQDQFPIDFAVEVWDKIVSTEMSERNQNRFIAHLSTLIAQDRQMKICSTEERLKYLHGSHEELSSIIQITNLELYSPKGRLNTVT